MSDLTPIFLALCQSPEFQDVLESAVIKALNKREIPKDPKPIFYTRVEACKLLHLTMPTLESYIKRGFIEAKRIGSRILISQEAVNTALKEMSSIKGKHRAA